MAWEVDNHTLEEYSAVYSGPKFHAVLCDPPYGIAFMGKKWDDAGGPEAFQEQVKIWGKSLLPLLHPGALILMFAGTRMWHRLAAGMENAGFQMWDTINYASSHDPDYRNNYLAWYYAQGFPKAQSLEQSFCSCEMCDLQKREENSPVPSQENKESDVLSKVCHNSEKSDNEGAPPKNLSDGAALVDTGKSEVLPGKDERCQQSDMERWRDVLPQTRELQTNQVRPMPAAVPGDGPEGRLCDGASPNHGDIGGPSITAGGSGSSHQSRSARQPARESGTVAEQSASQTMGTRCFCCGKAIVSAEFRRSLKGHKTAALKPSWEPILAFRAPTGGRTYAELATEFGSGCLNIDGARIGTSKNVPASVSRIDSERRYGDYGQESGLEDGHNPNVGRYPANLILDEESAAMLDEQTSSLGKGGDIRNGGPRRNAVFGRDEKDRGDWQAYGDSGGASRFFYCAKASRREREEGLDNFDAVLFGQSKAAIARGEDSYGDSGAESGGNVIKRVRNDHPTVKPINLCRWLATLLLPSDSVQPRRLLVPFSGSGSEMIGALQAGWDEVVGVEQDAHYCDITRARLTHWIGPESGQEDWLNALETETA